MRIRTIKPEFFLHDRLFDSEKDSGLPMRLAFIGLWCASDREGRFKWEPRRLGASILPYDMVDFSRVLDALTTRGFIEKHASQGVEFGVIPSFLRHQVINNRESPSALPEPTEESMVIGPPTREPREADACGTREVQVKAEGKGRKEGEGKGKGTGNGADAAEIYQLYPRKEARADALKAIEKALGKISVECLKEAVSAFAIAKQGQEARFIPHPATWFNGERWLDDRSTWLPKDGAAGAAPTPPSIQEWMQEGQAVATSNTTRNGATWPRDLCSAAYYQCSSSSWRGITDWRGKLRAECLRWVGNENGRAR